MQSLSDVCDMNLRSQLSCSGMCCVLCCEGFCGDDNPPHRDDNADVDVVVGKHDPRRNSGPLHP